VKRRKVQQHWPPPATKPVQTYYKQVVVRDVGKVVYSVVVSSLVRELFVRIQILIVISGLPPFK
jgi:hypothetical protein